MSECLNIATYKFLPLQDLLNLRATLLDTCTHLHLKGTILLSKEGMNVNLAGSEPAIRHLQAAWANDTRWSDLTYRESWSALQPFKFLRVKLRNEIITMKHPEVDPCLLRAKSIKAMEFKQWLDEERDITILDTRNDFEVRFGTFKNAIQFNLQEFSEFPQRVASLSKDKPIVMFCTGGVRCEKAGLYLDQLGYQAVYQLEGGILQYFAEVGGAHYEGECFVFDHRVSLDATLQPSGTQQCEHCEGPIPENEVQAAPYCRACLNNH